MKLIHYLLRVSVAVILVSIVMSRVAQARDVSIAEFVKLDFGQRVEICAQLVASTEIGDCASISPPAGETVSSADIMKMASSCFSGKIADSKLVGQCVREQLDIHKVPATFPSKSHIIRAYNICATQVASNELGACTASLCTRLEE